MRRADGLVVEPLRLLGAIGQHTLALVGERKNHKGRYLLANRGAGLDLLADGLDRGVRAQEAVGQRFVLLEQPKQQVLRFDVRAAELAGLVTSEEDGSPGPFGVALEHIRTLLQDDVTKESGVVCGDDRGLVLLWKR